MYKVYLVIIFAILLQFEQTESKLVLQNSTHSVPEAHYARVKVSYSFNNRYFIFLKKINALILFKQLFVSNSNDRCKMATSVLPIRRILQKCKLLSKLLERIFYSMSLRS